jgi:uncharacterized membrane protein
MSTVRGLVIAFGIFAASFALHIVGGATDQDWLFATAVVLIYLSAAGYPVIAYRAAGSPRAWKPVVLTGALIGIVLTASALRAANDRTFASWQPPLAVALVVITSTVLAAVASAVLRIRGRSPRPGTVTP